MFRAGGFVAFVTAQPLLNPVLDLHWSICRGITVEVKRLVWSTSLDYFHRKTESDHACVRDADMCIFIVFNGVDLPTYLPMGVVPKCVFIFFPLSVRSRRIFHINT